MKKKPWERKPHETVRAFEAFTAYRDMGADRSIRNAAMALGKSDTLLERWSARWSWKERAAAFDAHEEARREMGERQAKDALGLQDTARQALERIDPASLTIREDCRLAETVGRIEQAARGLEPLGGDPERSGPGSRSGLEANIEPQGRGEADEMTEAKKWLEWEVLPGAFRENREASLTMHRAKVPGGWLVYIYGSHYSYSSRSDWGHGGLAFYPDPEHKWDGNSLP